MEHGNFLEQLGLLVLAAAFFLVAARTMRLPGVVAYLLAGFLIGPVLRLTTGSGDMEWVLETGISLMLFLVGLEMSPELIRHLKGKPLFTGCCQVAVMTTLGGAFLALFDYPLKTCVTGGLALALSSTVVVLKLLQDRRETRSAYGQLALAILLTQDLVVIIGLTILEAMGGGEAPRGLAGVIKPLAKTVFSFAIVLAGCYAAWKVLLRQVFRWSRSTPDLLLVFSLGWCFTIVYVAHHLHLSAESGAFLAGISLAGLPHAEDLRRRVHPLMQFFIAIFFVSLAARMDVRSVAENPGFFIWASLFILVLKPVVMLGLFSFLRWRRRVGPQTALILGQISEFSLIFMTLAAEKGMVDEVMANTVLALALVSFPINIIIFQSVYRGRSEQAGNPETDGKGHIIVIGMNSLGRKLVTRLAAMGQQVIAVDTDPKKLIGLECRQFIGSTEYQETLEELHLERARLVISALRIEESNELIAYWCRMKGVDACIHGVDMNNLDRLLDLKVSYLILPKVDGIKKQVAELKKMGLLHS
jgi:Kef-type K+ transport system membrane component KefB